METHIFPWYAFISRQEMGKNSFLTVCPLSLSRYKSLRDATLLGYNHKIRVECDGH